MKIENNVCLLYSTTDPSNTEDYTAITTPTGIIYVRAELVTGRPTEGDMRGLAKGISLANPRQGEVFLNSVSSPAPPLTAEWCDASGESIEHFE